MAQDPPIRELQSPDELAALLRSGTGPVVLEFSASDRPASLAEFDAVAREYSRLGVQFFRVDTHAAPDLAESFDIRSTPTVVFLADGRVVEAAVGRIDQAGLTKRVAWLLDRSREHTGFFRRLFGRRR